MPPSSGKRDDSSLMTSAPGTKKKIAASIQRLMDEVPLCPAAAIQRGPRTAAMLKSSTSQKPMALRNCGLESLAAGAGMVMKAPRNEAGEKTVSVDDSSFQPLATSCLLVPC